MKFLKVWLVAVVVIFLGGLFYFTESFSVSTANGAETAGDAAIGGPFLLVDQHGKKVSDNRFRGKLMVVYFGFTNCPGVCPVDMAMITDALKQIGPDAAKNIVPVFITVDSKNDTPKKIAEYLKSFYPSFVGLTGNEEELKAVQKEYKAYASDQGNGMFQHSSNIYLMDKDGKYITHFSPGTDAEKIAAGIKEHL